MTKELTKAIKTANNIADSMRRGHLLNIAEAIEADIRRITATVTSEKPDKELVSTFIQCYN